MVGQCYYCKNYFAKTKEAFGKHTKVCVGNERIMFIPLKTEK